MCTTKEFSLQSTFQNSKVTESVESRYQILDSGYVWRQCETRNAARPGTYVEIAKRSSPPREKGSTVFQDSSADNVRSRSPDFLDS